MKSLLNLDQVQLHRIDAAIAALACQPEAERQRKASLLHALESEKQELMRCNPAIRVAARRKIAA